MTTLRPGPQKRLVQRLRSLAAPALLSAVAWMIGSSQNSSAGDIAVVVDGNDLYVTEDPNDANADNSVQIYMLDGQIRVECRDGRINGGENFEGDDFLDVGRPDSLYLDLAGGNDLLVMQGVTPLGDFTSEFVDVVLILGNEDAAPGSDEDQLVVWGIDAYGSMTVRTGADRDTLFINEADVGDRRGLDSLDVNTGTGSDAVVLEDSLSLPEYVFIRTFASASENDADGVILENLTSLGSIHTWTGGGADDLIVTNAVINTDMTFDTGSGNDRLQISGSYALTHFDINCSSGNDAVSLTNNGFISPRLNGGSGFDTLMHRDSLEPGDQKFGWEIINGRLTYSAGSPTTGTLAPSR